MAMIAHLVKFCSKGHICPNVIFIPIKCESIMQHVLRQGLFLSFQKQIYLWIRDVKRSQSVLIYPFFACAIYGSVLVIWFNVDFAIQGSINTAQASPDISRVNIYFTCENCVIRWATFNKYQNISTFNKQANFRMIWYFNIENDAIKNQ